MAIAIFGNIAEIVAEKLLDFTNRQGLFNSRLILGGFFCMINSIHLFKILAERQKEI